MLLKMLMTIYKTVSLYKNDSAIIKCEIYHRLSKFRRLKVHRHVLQRSQTIKNDLKQL